MVASIATVHGRGRVFIRLSPIERHNIMEADKACAFLRAGHPTPELFTVSRRRSAWSNNERRVQCDQAGRTIAFPPSSPVAAKVRRVREYDDNPRAQNRLDEDRNFFSEADSSALYGLTRRIQYAFEELDEAVAEPRDGIRKRIERKSELRRVDTKTARVPVVLTEHPQF